VAKPQIAKLAKLADLLPASITELEGTINQVFARMAALKKEGLVYATEYWRKDGDGTPKYCYLLYAQQPGTPRRREYIGCDTDRIEEARAGIARAKTYDALAARMNGLRRRIDYAAAAMTEALRHLKPGR